MPRECINSLFDNFTWTKVWDPTMEPGLGRSIAWFNSQVSVFVILILFFIMKVPNHTHVMCLQTMKRMNVALQYFLMSPQQDFIFKFICNLFLSHKIFHIFVRACNKMQRDHWPYSFFFSGVFLFVCDSVLDVCSINNDADPLWRLHACLYTWSVSLKEISCKYFAQ